MSRLDSQTNSKFALLSNLCKMYTSTFLRKFHCWFGQSAELRYRQHGFRPNDNQKELYWD